MGRTIPIEPPPDDGKSPTQALPGNERPMVLQAGVTLGPYLIEAFIRGDGLATIYRGYDPSLGRKVSIRVLPSKLVATPGSRERLQAEARAFDRLRHPSIVTLLGSGEEYGFVYLVTEFVDGASLADHLGAPLPFDQVVNWLTPIASALDYAHALGVFHRGVSPASILLTQEGAPILTDFSFVNVADQTLQLTEWSTAPGTAEYLAPEQVNGEAVGGASDQYSVAAIAFHLLTGRAPFTGETPLAMLLARVREPAPSPRSINPALSRAVEVTLQRGLAQHPADRFPSVGDFVGALSLPEPRGKRVWPLPALAPPSLRWSLLIVATLALLLLGSRLVIRIPYWGGRPQAVVDATSTAVAPPPTPMQSAVSTGRATTGQSATPTPLPAIVPIVVPATFTVTPALPTVTPVLPTLTPFPPTPTPGCVLRPSQPDDPAACRPVITSTSAYAMGYEGGEYFVRTTIPNADVAAPVGALSGDTYSNVELTVDAHLVGETADRVIVLGCRTMRSAAGKHTGYVLQVYPDLGATSLRKEVNDKPATLEGMTPSSAVKHGGAVNHLALRCDANRVSARVNDVEVVSVTDPAPLGEGAVDIGVVRLATGNGAAEVRFSNLALVGLPE